MVLTNLESRSNLFVVVFITQLTANKKRKCESKQPWHTPVSMLKDSVRVFLWIEWLDRYLVHMLEVVISTLSFILPGPLHSHKCIFSIILSVTFIHSFIMMNGPMTLVLSGDVMKTWSYNKATCTKRKEI